MHQTIPSVGFTTCLAIATRDTGSHGAFTGIHRTYLHPRLRAKASVPDAFKALGRIRGHAERLGPPAETLIFAEGIETALSRCTACPALGATATPGATGHAAFRPPPRVARLLIARDNRPCGDDAAGPLRARCRARGLDARVPTALRNDFNDDLLDEGSATLVGCDDETPHR